MKAFIYQLGAAPFSRFATSIPSAAKRFFHFRFLHFFAQFLRLMRLMNRSSSHRVRTPVLNAADCLDEKLHAGRELLHDRAFLRELCGRVERDEGLLRELTRHSYFHANGFAKVVLAMSADRAFHIRLHFWPDAGHEDQNIHDHRFDFVSRVLRGSITNCLWGRSDDGEEFQSYRYYPRSDASSYRMVRAGTTRLGHKLLFTKIAGEVYDFDSTWLHSIKCTNDPVTLLWEDRRALRPYANVHSQHLDSPHVRISSPALTPSEYLKFVRSAEKLIEINDAACR